MYGKGIVRMLDQETKRRIDSLRQILVGKVPDPKAQIDQITTALIYKFMDDMDREAVELGGRGSYFIGNFQIYSWSCLMDKKLSGHERLDLYVRAMTEIPKNEKLQDVFRNVFKNAFLPYRDSETLNLFLKEINEFEYDHSENLGNAFEYLLSILGSQGDAGQFRTPRHIIDFMVEVLDPQKDESILDPACGTAGFLISAYKHIIKNNSENYNPQKDALSFARNELDALKIQIQSNGRYKGEKLKPRERQKMQKHIVGYDISPDMMKFSLVNMYLHKFQQPQIYDYDTLTSDEKWGNDFDVILANPPFMSPKGGIRPHSRFSVRSNRSEVLFVDYIAEHLKTGGRAAVIVPEGVIFKSDKAYKQLRKMLVENKFLWAVVSLPSGIFQPYSGVKTSILFLDKKRAKVVDEILFVDVASDGFDLGATRRKIERNDLPEAFKVLCQWREGQKLKSSLAHLVGRSKIAEDGDYNLSSGRYKESKVQPSQWPMVALGNKQYFDIESGGTPNTKKKEYWEGDIPWVTLVDLPANNKVSIINITKRNITQLGLKKSSAVLLPSNSILISSRATIGRIGINKMPLATNQGFKNIIIRDSKKVLYSFVAYVLTNKVNEMQEMGLGGTFKEVSKTNVSKIKIPLPPLEVQREIVNEIEGYQKVIDGAEQVVKHWKPTIKIHPSWPLTPLSNVCEILDKLRKPVTKSDRKSGPYPYYGATGILDYVDQYIFDEKLVLVGEDGAKWGSGDQTAFIAEGKYWVNNHAHVLKPHKDKLIDILLVHILNQKDLTSFITGVTVPKLNQQKLCSIEIPLPPLEVQKQIVDKIEKERQLVESNKNLIKLFKQKIDTVINSIYSSTTTTEK